MLEDLPALSPSRPDSPVVRPGSAEALTHIQANDGQRGRGIMLENLPAFLPSRLDSPVVRPAEDLTLIEEDLIPAKPNEHLTQDKIMVKSLPDLPGQDGWKSEGAETFALAQASTAREDHHNITAGKAPTVLAAGLGLAVADTLQRQTTKQDKKKGAKKNKKQKKTFDWAQHEEEEEQPTQPTILSADQIIEPQHNPSGLPSELPLSNTFETEQHHRVQIRPEYPPDLTTPIVSRFDNLSEQRVSTPPHLNRDSAVHVTDSPLLIQTLPEYNPVRDSGYQDTLASPVFHSKQNSSVGSETQSPIGDDFERPNSQYPHLTNIASVPRPMPQLSDLPASIDSHQRADANMGSSHPLTVSVELEPAYELSVSRHRTKEPRSPIRSDRSVDVPWEQPHSSSERSGSEHLIEHSRNANFSPRSREDMRQPSPVESATKDRSSVLFHSSPSIREETTYHPAIPQTRDYLHEQKQQENQIAPYQAAESTIPELESSGLREASPDLPSSTSIATERASSLAALSGTSDIHQAPRLSLFGGPVGTKSDSPSVRSPPPASRNLEGRPLNTIAEYSPEESPLHKKTRALSDVGSPERGIKSVCRSVTPQSLSHNHLRSPPAQTSSIGSTPHSHASGANKSPISTDDFISRLSWPAVDEDSHSVDLERVLSRNTDRRPSSRHSNGSARVREGDHRSASGQSIRSGGSINRFKTPDRDHVLARPASGLGNRSATATPPLRRVDRSLSGDLRAANKRSEAKSLAKQADLGFDPNIPSSSTYDPIKDKGKGIARDMTDVYEEWGDVHGSPLSPTRPQSMRRRQSMQIIDLETKLDQLASENRLLQDAKSKAERGLEELAYVQNRNESAGKEALETRDLQLREKDEEIVKLRQTLEWVQKEVTRLTEVNEGLAATSLSLKSNQDQRYSQLQAEHTDAQQQWQQSTRELDELRQKHVQLSTGMEDIVRHEINIALEDKNAELRRLRGELEVAKEQIRTLQQQILASKPSDDLLVNRDEDYFDSQCQQLCQHVQQWVLRFSKFSDMKACHLASEVSDEKITDRFDNAILDGSDVDSYLVDRVKRRDVFMSVVMTMVWEFVFTRYLFGMDREQRQKLKSLEKILAEVGPMKAVHRWRATTLMLLSKREAFQAQRAQDTEAVVQEIYHTLSVFLPPPLHLVKQIQESLRNVMGSAVELSIEMRTQRAEYIMLPPLQPEYDTNGDLAHKVYFNAALMNERSGDTSSNEELEAQHAVVRMVLFPLVVKKGDDSGVGDEEIVVCPAQVLVAKRGKEKKVVRVLSGDRMSVDHPNKSVQSFAPSSMDMGNMI
ncbi:MAG: hypothetical protein M1830_001457 [Pleopsidium flavum]|nr:MAG: hypothetical protein M1830_001457 [Pleopsidium flavum]